MSSRVDEPPQPSSPPGLPERITLRDLRHWRRDGVVFPCLTAYDATMARWLARAGVPVMLVGDSAAEVVLGLPSTTHAPLDFLLQITAGVRRGAPNAFIIGDMPFLSYHADENDAVTNAARFMVEGHADAVKLEADARFASVFERLSRAGVPAIAHVGCLPHRSWLRRRTRRESPPEDDIHAGASAIMCVRLAINLSLLVAPSWSQWWAEMEPTVAAAVSPTRW